MVELPVFWIQNLGLQDTVHVFFSNKPITKTITSGWPSVLSLFIHILIYLKKTIFRLFLLSLLGIVFTQTCLWCVFVIILYTVCLVWVAVIGNSFPGRLPYYKAIFKNIESVSTRHTIWNTGIWVNIYVSDVLKLQSAVHDCIYVWCWSWHKINDYFVD